MISKLKQVISELPKHTIMYGIVMASLGFLGDRLNERLWLIPNQEIILFGLSERTISFGVILIWLVHCPLMIWNWRKVYLSDGLHSILKYGFKTLLINLAPLAIIEILWQAENTVRDGINTDHLLILSGFLAAGLMPWLKYDKKNETRES